MKLSIVDALAGLLGGMKLNRITDKAVKTALVNDYLQLRKFAKNAREETDDFRAKFREDWADEMFTVERLRSEGQPLFGHKEYLDAERDANQTLREIFEKDVDTSVMSVPVEDFVTACGGEELTLEQIAFLQENGILEE